MVVCAMSLDFLCFAVLSQICASHGIGTTDDPAGPVEGLPRGDHHRFSATVDTAQLAAPAAIASASTCQSCNVACQLFSAARQLSGGGG